MILQHFLKKWKEKEDWKTKNKDERIIKDRIIRDIRILFEQQEEK